MTKKLIKINSIDKVKEFVSIANACDCDLDLQCDRYIVNAKSIMGVFSMDILDDIMLTIYSNDANIVDKFQKFFA